MIKLLNVTLIALTGLDYKTPQHAYALEKSCEGIEFGAVKLIQLGKIKDIASWNEAIIKDLPDYVQTEYCLLIHDDGYVIHPELWNNEWLTYDFIGAPWPLPTDKYSYLDESGRLVRVGNSVSLRSKKLMELVKTRTMEFHYGNNNEDGHICCWNRMWLEEQGCKFAPLDVAIHFSKEHTIPENEGLSTFAFHSL